MARRRKRKQANINREQDNRVRPRNPYATRTHESRKAGAHTDRRKEQSRRKCRGKVDY